MTPARCSADLPALAARAYMFLLCTVMACVNPSLFAADVALDPKHPDRYVMVRGDTLWDISSLFLRDPRLWPEIWYVNPQIDNPHLIYKGDILTLVHEDEKPQQRQLIRVEDPGADKPGEVPAERSTYADTPEQAPAESPAYADIPEESSVENSAYTDRQEESLAESSAYIDQLIEFPEGVPPDDDGLDDDMREQPEGFRIYTTEYRHYQEDRDNTGNSYEDGLIFNARRETRHYGELELLATARSDRPSRRSPDGNSTGGRLTVRQYGFALTEDWLMDNSGGVLRSDADTLVSSSFRFNLPSTLLSGARTWTRTDATQIRLSAGKIGTLGTGRIEDFSTTSGKLAALGLSHALDTRWSVGAHMIALNDSDAVRDHETAAMALQYLSEDERHRYTGHVLSGTRGGEGAWLDGDNRLGRWRHRYGLFWLEPDILWSDASVSDDQQGLYTRSEVRAPRYNLTVGSDFSQNNVKDRDNRPQSRRSNLFITGNRRLRRETSAGGTVSLNHVDPRNDLAGEDAHVLRLSSYIQRRFRPGTSRFEVFVADIEDSGDNGNAYGLVWDQDWELLSALSLSTTLEHLESTGLDDERSNRASVLFRHEVSPNFNWNGSGSYTHIDRDNRVDSDNYNATLGAAWRFLPEWDARLDLTWTRAEDDADLLGNRYKETEKTLFLSIRHTRKRGRPMQVAGQKTGSSGFGTIRGQVFFDNNRDGVRQAGERAASGIFVYLDGRHERLTDADGSFEFTPVAAGKHTLSLPVEDLPLPWGLDDERPIPLNVPVRGTREVQIGLTRLDE